MIYNVLIEGQTLTMPVGIGEKDEDIKRAMAPYFPEIANALLTRKTEGEVTTITVVKRAGRKGVYSPIQALEACAGGKNPVIALYEEVEARSQEITDDPLEFLAIEARIEKVLEEGTAQAKLISKARERLIDTQPQPAPGVVVGF
jgi:hypothetical protein